MTVSTGGKVCIFIGFLVFLTGLFVAMSTLVGLFMIFAGIITMIQGNNMKAGPKVIPKQPEAKTYILEPKRDTKGALANVKSKGAV